MCMLLEEELTELAMLFRWYFVDLYMYVGLARLLDTHILN